MSFLEALRRISKYKHKIDLPMKGVVYWQGYKHTLWFFMLQWFGEVMCENAYEYASEVFFIDHDVKERYKTLLLQFARRLHKVTVPLLREGKAAMARMKAQEVYDYYVSRGFPEDLLKPFFDHVYPYIEYYCKAPSPVIIIGWSGEHRIIVRVRVADIYYCGISVKSVIKH